ncbi:MAG: extracellular solute-binding protein [Oscillospiraceae bacterium]|jgi:ABC-type glycerol-3-phosphate transport system substrate-binding protein|nr:extracellular solute-binding protein [Oscillospiraceae bacterium]
MRKAVSITLALLTLIGLGLTASAEAPKTTVNLYYATDLDVTLSATVAAYKEANPEVEVVVHQIPNDDYDDKLRVLMAGSPEELDVIWIRTPAQMKQYIGNNMLEDLTGYAQASGADLSIIRDTALKGAENAEETGFFGLPLSGSCWLLFYNKEIFDENGLDYPINITWEQYRELAKQLTYEKDGKKVWGGVIPPWTMNLGASAAGEYLNDPAPLTRTEAYAQLLYDLYTGDKSHISIEEMSSGMWDAYADFAAGNVAMTVNGDWTFRLLKTDVEYAAAPLPVFDDVPAGSSVGQHSYMCVSAASTNKQAAYDFIEFAVVSDTGTSIIARTDVPSYATDAALAVYKESVTTPGVEYRFTSRVLLEQDTAANYAAVNDDYMAELQLYILGEQDLRAAFDNFYALRDEE